MAIKTTNSKGMPRGTFRSNVKSRKLNQNGLEAQYQGLDIREVNIDHAGLAILGRSGPGFGFRDIVKTKRRYSVNLPARTALPKLVFEIKPVFAGNQNLITLYANTNTRLRITDFYGTEQRYQFTSNETSGTVLQNGYTAIQLQNDQYAKPLLIAIKDQILW